MVEADEEPKKSFDVIYEHHEKHQNFTLHDGAIIHTSEIYERLKNTNITIADVLADTTDYKAEIAKSKNPEARQEFAQKLGIRRLAVGVNKEHDALFSLLFGQAQS